MIEKKRIFSNMYMRVNIYYMHTVSFSTSKTFLILVHRCLYTNYKSISQ